MVASVVLRGGCRCSPALGVAGVFYEDSELDECIEQCAQALALALKQLAALADDERAAAKVEKEILERTIGKSHEVRTTSAHLQRRAKFVHCVPPLPRRRAVSKLRVRARCAGLFFVNRQRQHHWRGRSTQRPCMPD